MTNETKESRLTELMNKSKHKKLSDSEKLELRFLFGTKDKDDNKDMPKLPHTPISK